MCSVLLLFVRSVYLCRPAGKRENNQPTSAAKHIQRDACFRSDSFKAAPGATVQSPSPDKLGVASRPLSGSCSSTTTSNHPLPKIAPAVASVSCAAETCHEKGLIFGEGRLPAARQQRPTKTRCGHRNGEESAYDDYKFRFSSRANYPCQIHL